ncbi:MAG TPA: hypothetical protein VHF23_05365, partial [Gaiellaceae bacterium]|nr:hypothetical protein [Gaiellaceae bacterium]
SAESFRFLRPRPVKKSRPAADAAEARWIREANALCRRARRELERLPQPRTPEDAVELLEKVGPLNKRYNGEFLAIPAPASFGKELRELRRLFERDERLVARFLVAARERDGGRVLELAGKLEIASRDESAIMGALGAEDCDVYGYGGSS